MFRGLNGHGLPGFFISFEGGDRSGKSTQVERLRAHLTQRGWPVLVTREAGGTDLGEGIRRLVLFGPAEVSPVAETLLMMAARAQHVEEVIRPALSDGQVVLCDRFLDSTVAYQGWGLGVDLDFIERVQGAVTGGMEPDLTILLDLPVERMGQRGLERNDHDDRVESRGRRFHERVRQGFLFQAQRHSHRFKVVDATPDVERVWSDVKEHAMAALVRHRGRPMGAPSVREEEELP